MAEFFGEHHTVNGKRCVQIQILGPVHRLHSFIDIVSRLRLEVLDGF